MRCVRTVIDTRRIPVTIDTRIIKYEVRKLADCRLIAIDCAKSLTRILILAAVSRAATRNHP